MEQRMLKLLLIYLQKHKNEKFFKIIFMLHLGRIFFYLSLLEILWMLVFNTQCKKKNYYCKLIAIHLFI